MIKMQVIGHLGRDCNVNVVNGKSVMNITVAHSEKYKDSNGAMVDKTLWVDCSYWSDKTGIAPYLKKGTQVHVEGVPDIRTYTRNDGSFAASMILRVHSIQLLGSNNNTNNAAPGQQQSNAADTGNPYANNTVSDTPDDLPF